MANLRGRCPNKEASRKGGTNAKKYCHVMVARKKVWLSLRLPGKRRTKKGGNQKVEKIREHLSKRREVTMMGKRGVQLNWFIDNSTSWVQALGRGTAGPM